MKLFLQPDFSRLLKHVENKLLLILFVADSLNIVSLPIKNKL